MFRSLVPAVERVSFQPLSPLSKKILSACQEFASYVESTRPSDGGIPGKMRHEDLSHQALKQNGLCDQITKAMKDELNITCTMMLLPHESLNAMYSARISNKGPVTDPSARLSGLPQRGPARPLPKVFKDLQKHHDVNTGKLKKDFSNEYACDMYVTTGMFMTGEIYDNPTNVLTPAEIAAVILHEIGHAVLIIEHSADMEYRTNDALDSISYLSSTTDSSSHTKTVAAVVDAVKDMEADPKAKAAHLSLLEAAARTSPGRGTYVAFQIAALQISNNLISEIKSSIFGFVAKNAAVARISLSLVKTSDTKVTQRNVNFIERYADEFASRHGFSAASVSAQIKMNNLDAGAMQWSRVALIQNTIHAFSNVVSLVSRMLLPPMITPYVSGYDDDIKRIELLVENNMSVFKNANMPAVVRKAMLADTEAARKLVASYKSQNYVKVNKFIWHTLLRLAQPDSATGAVIDANLVADYDRLQDLTRGLIRTPLYYHAAQLQDMLEGQKK